MDAASATVEEGDSIVVEGGEALEAALRYELLEIARSHGLSHPEDLREVLLAALSDKHRSRFEPRDVDGGRQAQHGYFFGLANHSRELIAGMSSLQFDDFAKVFRTSQPPYQTETCVCVPLEEINDFPAEKQTTINYRIKNLLRPM